MGGGGDLHAPKGTPLCWLQFSMNIESLHVAFRVEIWSPAGGFFADPKHWRRNTAVAVMCVVIFTFIILVCLKTNINISILQRHCHRCILHFCQEHLTRGEARRAYSQHSLPTLGTPVIPRCQWEISIKAIPEWSKQTTVEYQPCRWWSSPGFWCGIMILGHIHRLVLYRIQNDGSIYR